MNAAAQGGSDGVGDLGALWESVRGLVAKSAAQSSVVELFELKSVRGAVAEVVVRDPGKLVAARAQLNLVSGLLSKASGMAMTAKILEAGAASESSGPTSTSSTSVSAGARLVAVDAATRNQAMEQPLVKKAVDLFGARLIGVEEDQGTGD